jgi:hypothetical protein
VSEKLKVLLLGGCLLPAASVSQAAASETHHDEPKSERMQLYYPEPVATAESPASPEPGLASQE